MICQARFELGFSESKTGNLTAWTQYLIGEFSGIFDHLVIDKQQRHQQRQQQRRRRQEQLQRQQQHRDKSNITIL
jgi:hypothetical protein